MKVIIIHCKESVIVRASIRNY